MKTIILSLLTVAILLGAYHLYSTNQTIEVQEDQILNNRSFFKKWGKKAHELINKGGKLQQSLNDVPEIVTYGINMEIDVAEQERSEGIDEANQSVKLTAQCDVQTIYDEELNIFDIAVSYTMVNKHDVKLQEEQEQEDYVFEESDNGYFEEVLEVEKEEQFEETQNEDQFFLLQVDADSGEILSLQIESAYEEDQMVSYATQQLINDIFPELRKESFQNGNIEEDNLGAAKVDYASESIDENTLAITKEYNSRDYVELEVPDLEIPESDFERTVLVDKETGLVTEGLTDYKFTLGDVNEEVKLRQADGDFDAEVEVEALGQISGEMKSAFWIVKPTSRDIDIATEMFRYRSEATFEPKKLNKEMKADIEYGNGESEEFELVDINEPEEVIIIDDKEEIDTTHSDLFVENIYDTDTYLRSPQQEEQQEKLQNNGQQTFQQVNQLAGTKILGKSIGIDFVYTGYTQVSTVALKIKVGSGYIATIIQKQLNNCKASHNEKLTTKSITFFKATFPVLGIVVIPVSAQGRFTYGYTTTVRTATRFCELSIVPQFKASIYGDGKVSLLGIISAGVYAQGNILDTKLTLKATTQQGKSSLSLVGEFHAFGFEMGVVYDKINCSLKNVLGEGQQKQLPEQQNKLQFKKLFKKVKKVVKKVVHVAKKVVTTAVKVVKNLTKICTKTPGYLQIAKFTTGKKVKNIWNLSVPIGI